MALPWIRSIRRPRQTPISNGRQIEDEVHQRDSSLASDRPAVSPGRPWTSIAGSTTRTTGVYRKDVATVDELHASATKLVGLDDFGTDDAQLP